MNLLSLMLLPVAFVAGAAIARAFADRKNTSALHTARIEGQSEGFKQGLIATNQKAYEHGYAAATIDALIEQTRVVT